MMRRRARGGWTTLELCVLWIAAMTALVAMWRPLVGAIGGRWKQAGDSFSSGLQYEPNRTTIQ